MISNYSWHHVEPGEPVPTARYLDLLAAATRFATAEGHTYVGAEHLLMAMIDDGSSAASAAIERLAPLEAVRGELRTILDSDGYRGISC